MAYTPPALRDVRELVSQLGEAVVQVRTPSGLGSGFIINQDGFLITNFHVIEGETQISVEVYHQKDGQLERKAYKEVHIIAINKFQDIALLKIDDKDAPKFVRVLLGDSDALSEGDSVFAIGSPLGLERTVTEGILSTKTREMEGELYLQTTAQINPGNSGGPLFNLRGEVVGVTNMKITFGGGTWICDPHQRRGESLPRSSGRLRLLERQPQQPLPGTGTPERVQTRGGNRPINRETTGPHRNVIRHPSPMRSQARSPSETHNYQIYQMPMKKAFTLLAALVCLSVRTPAAVLPAEKLLPDDTLALFSIPDFAKARETLKHSPQGRFWQDPSLKPFKDKFLNKLKEQYITPLEQQMGIHFADYAGLPQGQITLAVTQNGWSGQDSSGQIPAVLLLVDTRDKSGQLKTSLTDLRKKWVDAGKPVRIEKIRDIEFSVVTVSTNDLPKALRKAADAPPANAPEAADKSDAGKTTAKKDIYVGQAGSLLIVANSARAIEKVLAARLSGDDIKTVSDVPSFAADTAIFHDAFFFGWVNTKTFVDLLAHEQGAGADSESSGNPMDFKPAKVIAALGVDGLKDLALSYKYSDEGIQDAELRRARGGACRHFQNHRGRTQGMHPPSVRAGGCDEIPAVAH